MTRSELIERIKKDTEGHPQKAEGAVGQVLGHIYSAIQSGETVELFGFGTFRVIQRKARQGHNPKTGEIIAIPAKKAVTFSPAKALKEAVNR